MKEILEQVDTLCTKYYKLGQMETFRELNGVYHNLRKLMKGVV